VCGALRAVADLLVPLETAIVARNAQARHAHADETSWRVFERPEDKEGYRWWLWVFLAADTVVFTMDLTRSTKVLERHFGIDRTDAALPDGRRLVLSTDFYTAYQCLARIEGVDPLWCWAHIRRYFMRAGDAHVQLRYWRDKWVARIADLYVAHRGMADADVGSVEHTLARADFDQALATMDTARREQAAIYSLHPAARKVLATLDREWDGLVCHRDFPDIALDNNPAERALRNPVVGRKNYYGSHAQWAAYLAARVWTITATAERNGREPLAYLTEYLNACATTGGNPPEGQALQPFRPWLPHPRRHHRQPRRRSPHDHPAKLRDPRRAVTVTTPATNPRTDPDTRPIITCRVPSACPPTARPNTYGWWFSGWRCRSAGAWCSQAGAGPILVVGILSDNARGRVGCKTPGYHRDPLTGHRSESEAGSTTRSSMTWCQRWQGR
jgi:hypothetical protein